MRIPFVYHRVLKHFRCSGRVRKVAHQPARSPVSTRCFFCAHADQITKYSQMFVLERKIRESHMQVDMSANSGSEQRATAEHLCKDGVLSILLTDVFDVLSISSHVFVVFADRSSLRGSQDAVSSLLSDILHLLSLTRPCFLRSISIIACTCPRAIMVLTNKSWGLFLCILSRPPACPAVAHHLPSHVPPLQIILRHISRHR